MASPGSSWLRRIAAFILFAVGTTGFFVLLARATTPGHYEALRVHVWAGWALLLVGGPALAHHLAQTSRMRWTIASAGALLIAGTLALDSATGLAAPEGTGPGEHLLNVWQDYRLGLRLPRFQWVPPLALGGMLAAALLLTIASVGARLEQLRAARWWGLALTLLIVWAAVSGAGLPLVPRDHVFTGLAVHSAVGVFALALVLQHVVAVRLARRGFGRARSAALSVLLLIGVGVGAVGIDRVEHLFPRVNREWAPGVSAVRTPRTKEERAAAALPDSDWPRMDPSHRLDSMSCMAAGCHPDIGREWAGSAHRFSATNAFYRAAVGDLLQRGDREGAVFCANCHDPERVLTGEIATAYGADGVLPTDGSDGVSCLVCHAMVAVDSEPPGNGLFTIATAAPHTQDAARFRDDVLLDPRRHDELLGVNQFVLSPVPCRSCHRLQLGRDHGVMAEGGVVIQNQGLPESAPGYGEVTCEECHLPRPDRLFDQYTHRMPGINADQATYVPLSGDEDAALVAAYSLAAAEQAGLAPWLAIDDPAWPPSPPKATMFVGLDEPSRILGLRLDPSFGDGEMRLEVTTRNLRVGHDFPSGPLDLQQVWLEVRVTDATGRVLHHVGGLDEADAIEGDPPRLGGRELDAAGEDIRRHRLFDIATVEKRVLALGAAAQDSIDIPVDPGVAYPLDVRARWLFRRANPSFARWALGGDEDGSGSPIATHELVAAHLPVPAPE